MSDFACSVCGLGYTSKKSLAKHIKQKHGDKVVKFKCEYELCVNELCGREFGRPYTLVEHMRDVHHTSLFLDQAKKPSTSIDNKCDIQPPREKRVHKIIKCECGAELAGTFNYNRHLKRTCELNKKKTKKVLNMRVKRTKRAKQSDIPDTVSEVEQQNFLENVSEREESLPEQIEEKIENQVSEQILQDSSLEYSEYEWLEEEIDVEYLENDDSDYFMQSSENVPLTYSSSIESPSSIEGRAIHAGKNCTASNFIYYLFLHYLFIHQKHQKCKKNLNNQLKML